MKIAGRHGLGSAFVFTDEARHFDFRYGSFGLFFSSFRHGKCTGGTRHRGDPEVGVLQNHLPWFSSLSSAILVDLYYLGAVVSFFFFDLFSAWVNGFRFDTILYRSLSSFFFHSGWLAWTDMEILGTRNQNATAAILFNNDISHS